MERILVLIRHAKSDWGSLGTIDFERKLNERGRRDAPEMGRRLKHKNVIPDLILSSAAKRAKLTATLIAEEVGYEQERIQFSEQLYHCPAADFESVLRSAQIADDVKTVFVVGHNPGITYFANDVTQGLSLDNMPTCGIVAMRFNADCWSDFDQVKHHLVFFDYPKQQ